MRICDLIGQKSEVSEEEGFRSEKTRVKSPWNQFWFWFWFLENTSSSSFQLTAAWQLRLLHHAGTSPALIPCDPSSISNS